jgi:hypothetical protein
MNNEHVNLTNEDIASVRGMFTAFKNQAIKAGHRAEQQDFELHCVKGEELFTDLSDLVNAWGSQDNNYNILQNAFEAYIKSDSRKGLQAFSTYSTLFKLVAKLMESRDFIYFMENQFSKTYRNIDSFDSANIYNGDIVFSKN